MSEPIIHVIGVGADGPAGLSREQIERIRTAEFLAGGDRHLEFFPDARGERFVIGDNLPALVAALDARLANRRCVVLATGDPLFYGIGRMLVSVLGSTAVRVEPAVSSMQLAFARAGLSWQDAEIDSVHGRVLRQRVLPLLGRPLLGLFTHDGDSPAHIARFFLSRGLTGYAAVVGENLGCPDERITRWPDLAALQEQKFAPLNFLILQRTTYSVPFEQMVRLRGRAPGVPDDCFDRPSGGPEVMTRQEVRSVVVGKLINAAWQPGDVVWDVGAGLGTIAVELAVLRRGVEVVAVERKDARADHLHRNRALFDAYNLRIVVGEAPEALHAETNRPRAVYIGGSGGRLPEVLDFVAGRLANGGRLVAGFVTLENWMMALQKVRDWGWSWDLTEINVARSDALAGLTGLKPMRGVFVLSATKPEDD